MHQVLQEWKEDMQREAQVWEAAGVNDEVEGYGKSRSSHHASHYFHFVLNKPEHNSSTNNQQSSICHSLLLQQVQRSPQDTLSTRSPRTDPSRPRRTHPEQNAPKAACSPWRTVRVHGQDGAEASAGACVGPDGREEEKDGGCGEGIWDGGVCGEGEKGAGVEDEGRNLEM